MEGRRVYGHAPTTYEYEPPVEQSFNSATCARATRCTSSALAHLEIDPSGHATEHLDAFGNYVSTFLVTHRHDRLSVISTARCWWRRTRRRPSAVLETARTVLETTAPGVAAPGGSPSLTLRAPRPVLEDYASLSFLPGVPDRGGGDSRRASTTTSPTTGFTSVTTPLLECSSTGGGCARTSPICTGLLRAMGSRRAT